MSVARAGDVLGARAELDRQRRLRDQVRGARTEDVDAEHAVGLRVGDHLDETVALFHGARAPVGEERELANLYLAALLRALFLGLADRGELRPRVDAA